MTGSITAAWSGLKTLNPQYFSTAWIPFGFALAFGVVSFLISFDTLKQSGTNKAGNIAGAIFIGFINSLVLASAVIGASVVTGTTP
jgi:hypothetical protein